MNRIAALVLAAAIATPAMALPGLGKEPRVTEGLINVAIAFEVSRVCPDISARRLRGINYLFSLKSTARDLGYSNAQIDAFIDNSSEKQRLEGIARTRLSRMGAKAGQPQTYCHVGRVEIAKGSDVGRLLR